MIQLTDEQQEQLCQIRARLENVRPEEPLPVQVLLDANYLLILLDSDCQAAGSDLKSRDDVLAFFGASLKENGDLHIDMKKYHAAHLCQEHSFQPWRRAEIEEKCVMCLARDRENAATRMRDKCVEKVRARRTEKQIEADARRDPDNPLDYHGSYGLAVGAVDVCDDILADISSLTLDPLEPEKQ